MRNATPAGILTTDMQGRKLSFDPSQTNGWQRWRAEAEGLAGVTFAEDPARGAFSLDATFGAYLRGRTPAEYVGSVAPGASQGVE